MTSQALDRDAFGGFLEDFPDGSSCRRADGVPKGDFVAAFFVHLLRNVCDDTRLHWAFVGTTTNAGDIPTDADLILLGLSEDGSEALEALLDGAVDVLFAEGFRSTCKDRYFLRSSCDCLFVAPKELLVRRGPSGSEVGLSYLMLGTKTGYETPGSFSIWVKSAVLSAI